MSRKKVERIGEKYQSNNGQWATIIDIVDGKYIARFDSGFIVATSYSAIEKGRIKDGLTPSLCGVGYLGNVKRKGNERVYLTWCNMIRRCYDPSYEYYNFYGGKGVTVCSRWHCFSNFLEDVTKIEGFDEIDYNNGNLQLDKDIKQQGVENKIYSLETCIFVDKSTNTSVQNKSNLSRFIAISPDGDKFESVNLRSFCKEHGLAQSNASRVLNGIFKQTKGWRFLKIQEEE